MKAEMKFFLVAMLVIASFFLTGCENSVNYKPPAGSTGIAITHYSFGKMTIDDKHYDRDLVIMPNGEVKNWSIDLGSHILTVDDLTPFFTEGIKSVIIGTGNIGAVRLSDDTQKLLEALNEKNVRIIVDKTAKAVKEFNKAPKDGLVAFFHLNC